MMQYGENADLFRKYAVDDVTTVTEFLDKYYKRSRYTDWGEEYAAVLLAHHQADFDRDGFDIISHHDSKTGETVAFYRRDE
jgi:hypothetical protein